MPILQIMPNKISSYRPTKKKIVRTIYTTEKIAKNIQQVMPYETKSIAQFVYDGCKSLRTKLTKN